MQQTLLALLALALASLFTYTSHQRYVFVEQRLIGQEIAELAGSVAKESMEIVANQDDGDDNFGNDLRCSQFHTAGVTCDDRDDFHNMREAIRDVVISGDTFEFAVNINVEYRDLGDPDTPSGVPTDKQAVTISVQDYWGGDYGIYLLRPIELTRTFDK